MKKLICMLLILLLGLPCALAEEKTLYDHGMDLVSRMAEKAATPAWLQFQTPWHEILSLAETVAALDYSDPVQVYALTVTSSYADLLPDELRDAPLPEAVQANLQDKMPRVLVEMINGAGGSTCLATASVLQEGKTFVYPELTQGVIYLYDFGHEYPAMVVFIPGEDGTVQAQGVLILSEYFDMAAISPGSSFTAGGITADVETIR